MRDPAFWMESLTFSVPAHSWQAPPTLVPFGNAVIASGFKARLRQEGCHLDGDIGEQCCTSWT